MKEKIIACVRKYPKFHLLTACIMASGQFNNGKILREKLEILAKKTNLILKGGVLLCPWLNNVAVYDLHKNQLKDFLARLVIHQ